MLIRSLIIISILALSNGAAFAQDRAVPLNREEVTLSFAPLVKKVAPAVVNIYTKRTVFRRAGHPFMSDPLFQQFFGGGFAPDLGGGLSRKQVEGALGSGLIVDPAGIVVTNAHVIKGADEIRVVLLDGREFDATLSLMDEHSDLAILRIESAASDLPYATLRPSEELAVGDLVLAIGNPFGVGQTVTSGIVSALARSSLNISDFNFFIQTDAAVNPGNSGGPLVAMDGRVVGINTAIYSQSGGSLGIGFAIPSEMVQTVILAESGGQAGENGILRPWLGVTSQPITRDIAESLGLEKPAGTLISDMHKASPLHKAGVRVGDVIVSMNGKPIQDGAEMKYRMATVALGSTADIGVYRNGKIFDTKITAIAPPDDPPRNQTVLKDGLFSGVTVANLNPAVASEIGDISQDDGVVVINIDRRNNAAARFLTAGDIIVRLNGVDIEKVSDLKKVVSRPATMLDLVVNRQGQMQQIVIR
ncbi:MAG: Do family serine endopeptidase [Micavibrio sp.]